MTPLGRLPTLTTTSHEGSCTREDTGQDLQGATVRANVKHLVMIVAVRGDGCVGLFWGTQKFFFWDQQIVLDFHVKLLLTFWKVESG